MNNLPVKEEILLAIKELGLTPSTPYFIDQVSLGYDFVDAQLCSGYKEGKFFPSDGQIERWAGFYINEDAVKTALYLHGISGLNRAKPTLPKIHRLSRHPRAGSHLNYRRRLIETINYDPEVFISARRDIDSLCFRGAEGRGFKRVDLIEGIKELRELIVPLSDEGSNE